MYGENTGIYKVVADRDDTGSKSFAQGIQHVPVLETSNKMGVKKGQHHSIEYEQHMLCDIAIFSH